MELLKLNRDVDNGTKKGSLSLRRPWNLLSLYIPQVFDVLRWGWPDRTPPNCSILVWDAVV